MKEWKKLHTKKYEDILFIVDELALDSSRFIITESFSDNSSQAKYSGFVHISNDDFKGKEWQDINRLRKILHGS